MITGSIQQQFLKIFSLKLLTCELGNKPLPPRKGPFYKFDPFYKLVPPLTFFTTRDKLNFWKERVGI